jgi:uncharacterized protein YjbI with pentapeptide repeats
MEGCKLCGAILDAASFHHARLGSCDFSESEFNHAEFYGALLRACRFILCYGVSANFSNARLKSCDFAKADLSSAKFSRADFGASQFDRAVLADADFRHADLTGANFSRSDLSNAHFGGAKLFAADLRAANLTGAHELTATHLTQARTDEATILPNGSKGPYRRYSGAERPVLV